jgi:hypothetical protein
MKLTVNQLRQIIKEALNEEARKAKDALADRLALAVIPGELRTYMLYDPVDLLEKLSAAETSEDDAELTDAVHAVVAITKPEFQQWGAKEVARSAAVGGYGPLLYDIAMDDAGGLTPDRDSVSRSAQGVWRYYMGNRDDVEKKPLDDAGDPKTPTKKDDSTLHPGGKRSPLNYAYFIKKGPGTARLKANHEKFRLRFRGYGGNNFLYELAQKFFIRHYGVPGMHG